MLRKLAASQHGVVSRRQLLAAGVTEKALRVRLQRGSLLPLHRGVYAVGHAQLRPEGRWLAAVLAVPGAVLSHREAAALHGIRDGVRRTVDVTTAAPVRRTTATALVVHRAVLDPHDVTRRRGIPVTTVARTLADLAWLLTPDQSRTLLGEADRRELLDVPQVRAALARVCRRRGSGTRTLHELLADHDRLGSTFTRSVLEDRFLTLLDAHDLPRPLTNHVVAGLEVDACWPAQRLIAELDGYVHHRGRGAFAADRARDAHLLTAGYRVVRFTHPQVAERSAWVAATVKALLGAPSGARATMSDRCR